MSEPRKGNIQWRPQRCSNTSGNWRLACFDAGQSRFLPRSVKTHRAFDTRAIGGQAVTARARLCLSRSTTYLSKSAHADNPEQSCRSHLAPARERARFVVKAENSSGIGA